MSENWFPKEQPARWGIGSRWQTWMARLFGERIEGTDGRYTVIAYRWRGRVYVVREELQ